MRILQNPQTLDLNDLSAGGIPAITPAMGAALAEAGGVSLESQGHNQGVRLTVGAHSDTIYNLTWPAINEQAHRSWNEPTTATEKGAEGIAVLLAKIEIGYEVIRRSRIGTGFDYWLGSVADEGFVDKAGLEISGIHNGTAQVVRARVREKLRQAATPGNDQLETYAIVVEFGTPLAEVQRNDIP